MVTIKQLADELGVSKQAVYSRITKEPLKSTLEGIDNAVQTSAQGTIFLSEEGANIIRTAYAEKQSREVQKKTATGITLKAASVDESKLDNLLSQVGSMQKAVSTLLEYTLAKDAKITTLEEKLAEKDAMIFSLTNDVKGFTETSSANDEEMTLLKSKLEQAEELVDTLQQQLSDWKMAGSVQPQVEPDPEEDDVEELVEELHQELPQELDEEFEEELDEEELEDILETQIDSDSKKMFDSMYYKLKDVDPPEDLEPPVDVEVIKDILDEILGGADDETVEEVEQEEPEEPEEKEEAVVAEEEPSKPKSFADTFDQIDSLFEPLLSFSDDEYNSPTNRLSKLLTK